MIGDIDEKKTESVRVQTKSSGSWWIIGREKEEVSEEPAEMKQTETKQTEKKKPPPMRRATVGESKATTDKSQPEKKTTEAEAEKPGPKRRATWLTRSPSNASMTSVTPQESSKEVVKADPAGSSGFWKLNLSSSSNAAAPPTNTTTAVVPATAAAQGEGVYPLTHSHPFTQTHVADPYLHRQSLPQPKHKRRSGSLMPATPSTSSRTSTPK